MSREAKGRVPVSRGEVSALPVCLPGGCRMYPWRQVGEGGYICLPSPFFAPGHPPLGPDTGLLTNMSQSAQPCAFSVSEVSPVLRILQQKSLKPSLS